MRWVLLILIAILPLVVIQGHPHGFEYGKYLVLMVLTGVTVLLEF